MFRVGKCLSTQNRAGNRRPSLNLNFQGGRLDSRVTFSRTSNATLTGSNGLIQYAPNNLLTFSEQFDNAIWQSTAGSVTANSTTAPNGTLTADLFNAAIGTTLFTTVACTPNTAYTFSFYVELGTLAAADYKFAIRNDTAGVFIAQDIVPSVTLSSTEWARVTYSFTTPAGCILVRPYALRQSAGAGVGTFYIWGAQLNVGSLQPYYPTTTAAYYGPRFDYDPITLACKGLLIEEQRVNLLTYSEQFDNAAWTKAATTVTANSVIAPDGTLTADTLIESATLAQHAAFQAKTLTAAAHTFTVYAKKSTGPQRWLTLYPQGTGISAIATYNVNTGSVFSSSGAQLLGTSITDVGNGWYRCSIIFTGAAVSVTNVIYLTNNSADPAPSYTGDGTSGIYIWGAQLEAGAFATSYIPTVASQVTRTADNASMTGTNFSSWYNASEGTLNTNFAAVGRVANTRQVAQICDGSSNNNLQNYLYDTINGTSARIGAVTQADIGLGSYAENTNYKVASGFALNNVNGSANGSIGTTDTSVTLPSTLDRLYIGCGAANSVINTNTAGHLNGTIKSISYYPRRLTNAELQAITA